MDVFNWADIDGLSSGANQQWMDGQLRGLFDGQAQGAAPMATGGGANDALRQQMIEAQAKQDRMDSMEMTEGGLMQLANAFRPPSDTIQPLPAPYSGGHQIQINPGRGTLMALMQQIISRGAQR